MLMQRKLYANSIQSYDAEVYIKENSIINRKNILFPYAPDFLYWNKKGDDYFVEALISVHFNAPNYFNQQIKAINGTGRNAKNIENRVTQFLNVNIYNPVLFNSRVLLPGIEDIHKYYRFEYVSCFDTLKYRVHKIKVIPLVKSQKLISGCLNVVDGMWNIFSFDMEGSMEFSRFRIETEFGTSDDDFLLPKRTCLTLKTKLLGNEVVSSYFSLSRYISVVRQQTGEPEKKTGYDLSSYFIPAPDTLPVVKDSVFWEEKRPIPLSDSEKHFYKSKNKIPENIKNHSVIDESWNLYQRWMMPKHFNYNNAQFSYSGFLNPLKLAYSQSNGISYWQQLQLNKVYGNGNRLNFSPNAVFLFKNKEIYFNLPLKWTFQPRRMGEINFTFGNRNQSYNSKIIDKINKQTDSVDFNSIDLEYYRHFFLELKFQYEIANGLLALGGIDYDWYNSMRINNSSDQIINNEELADIDHTYRALLPDLKIIWTPGLYYRFNGKRKEYISSNFPTFSISYGRGIKNLFRSVSDYERIELDLQQKINLNLTSSVQYYVGSGIFTNTRSVYFADFKNFQKYNFPKSWSDPIGGVFHLLNGEWYNASNSYIQGHFMYETSFILLKLFRGVAKDILTERFYLSQLYTPALPCYTEIGFGFGNFIINTGAFVSFKRGEFQSFGVKAVFEIGR
ncbi:MAG: DUF5686 family protein [Dysgonamonadaceae bacterium]|nr:DUF5686 family protein [Dysgonamonadaceae bacterium]